MYIACLGWDISPSQGYPPSIKLAGTHTWVERVTLTIKCHAQEHDTMSQPGPKPTCRPIDTEVSTLTMRSLCLHKKGFYSVSRI